MRRCRTNYQSLSRQRVRTRCAAAVAGACSSRAVSPEFQRKGLLGTQCHKTVPEGQRSPSFHIGRRASHAPVDMSRAARDRSARLPKLWVRKYFEPSLFRQRQEAARRVLDELDLNNDPKQRGRRSAAQDRRLLYGSDPLPNTHAVLVQLRIAMTSTVVVAQPRTSTQKRRALEVTWRSHVVARFIQLVTGCIGVHPCAHV